MIHIGARRVGQTDGNQRIRPAQALLGWYIPAHPHIGGGAGSAFTVLLVLVPTTSSECGAHDRELAVCVAPLVVRVHAQPALRR
jgi:hypothetical protein